MANWLVKPVSSYIGKYKNARRIIMEAIAQREDLSIPERLALFEVEMGKQMDLFRKERREEYESKTHAAKVRHSCTNGVSGEKKDCGWKDVSSPHPDLYTRSDWIVRSGTIKKIRIAPNGSSAGMSMSKSGRGKNSGAIDVTFRYRPDVVSRRVVDDSNELLNLISDDGGNPRA